MLLTDFFLDLFPFDTEGWIGQHIVEFPVRVAVFREGIAEHNVAHILPLYEHIGLADRVGFRVEFLTKHCQPRLRVVFS